MKNMIKTTVMVAILSTATFASNSALTVAAEPLPQAVIAIIDSRMVRFNSAAGKDIQKQLDVIRKKFQAEVAVEEKKLMEEEATLKTQRAILPKESYDAKLQDFQNKVVTAQREVQIKNSQLEAALNNAQSELQRALKPIFQKVLKENNATMIMDVSLVIEKTSGLDVTTRVIEELDQALPSIKVELPAAPVNAPVK